MSLLPRKEKNLPSWKLLGYTDVLLDEFIFSVPSRQLEMRVKRVMMTFSVNLQRLTKCCSRIHQTYPLIVERPTLQNTAQLS